VCIAYNFFFDSLAPMDAPQSPVRMYPSDVDEPSRVYNDAPRVNVFELYTVSEDEPSTVVKLPDINPSEEPTSRSGDSQVKQVGPPKWLYWSAWALPRLILIPFLALFFMWVLQAEGGVGFDEASLFGMHAVLMVLFVVVCTQEAILTYTVPLLGPLMARRPVKKWFHLCLHLCGMGLAIGGLVAIMAYKRLSPTPVNFPFFSMYSPHSWVAICFLTLWLLQLIAGFAVYLVGKSPQVKAATAKYHRFLGLVTYTTGLATCALGFQDMQSSDLGAMYLAMNMTGSGSAGMDMSGMDGYLYDSALSDYASACALLLVFLGIATAFAQLLK